MPFSSFGESVTDSGFERSEKIFALAGRHRQALQLGEAALRRPIYSSYGKVVSCEGRKDLFKEEMDILKELLSNLYYFNSGISQAGFALQKIILVNLNHRLKARRNEAEEDLIVSGEGTPALPRWGLTGKADEFWTANDFEILGACYRREVENFLAYLAEHHDFSKAKKTRKQEQRVIVSHTPHRRTTINPPTITAVRDFQPAFLEGEPDSISAHLRKSRTVSNNPVANMNTSVFGHPVQNSSSQALKELFGVKQPKTETVTFGGTSKFRGTNFGQESVRDALSGDEESIHTRSSRTRDSKQATPTQGGGDPGDSDGDDSDDGGRNNGPWKGPRKPLSPSSGRKTHSTLFQKK